MDTPTEIERERISACRLVLVADRQVSMLGSTLVDWQVLVLGSALVDWRVSVLGLASDCDGEEFQREEFQWEWRESHEWRKRV